VKVRLVSFTPWLLYPEYPPNRKLGEPHSWSGHLNKEKSLSVSGIEPQFLGFQIYNLGTLLIVLSWLLLGSHCYLKETLIVGC